MAHAAVFDVVVDSWNEKAAGRSSKSSPAPRAVTATCKACSTKFQATDGQRASDGTFATYLGAIHLRCPKCGAEGPVQLRKLKR